jgi:predicted Zn-dependent peptidase
MVDRSVAPSFTAPQKFILPRPEIRHLKNGARLFSLCVGDQPVIKLEFVLRAGLRFEKNPGEAFFAAKMLLEGTTNFTSKSISESLDQYGAFVEVNPGFDYTIISIHIPTSFLDKIEQIISEILFEPTFPEDELELLKQIQTQQTRVNQQKNSFVASRIFRSRLFPNNPYGHIMDEKVIAAIGRNDVVAFYGSWMQGKFDVFLTGNFDKKTPESIIRMVEDKLEKPHMFNELEPAENIHFEEFIEKEDSLQSAIYLGNKSINRTHKKYGKILLLNEIFGGYFGSRLMQNIREDKGLTYSIYSHLASMKDDAYFVISSDVKKELKDQALDEIGKEIAEIKSELIGQKELQQAKNYLKGSILNTLTNPFAITDKLKNIFLYDLGDDFYDHLFDDIDQVDAEELRALANDILFARPLSSAIVG